MGTEAVMEVEDGHEEARADEAELNTEVAGKQAGARQEEARGRPKRKEREETSARHGFQRVGSQNWTRKGREEEKERGESPKGREETGTRRSRRVAKLDTRSQGEDTKQGGGKKRGRDETDQGKSARRRLGDG